jgi:hopanoid biosynthesis associated membrane protein HpnM
MRFQTGHNTMRALFKIVTVVLALVVSAGGAIAAGPEQPIETLHATLLDAMKMGQSAGVKARYAALKPNLEAIYNFQRMIEVATGSYWTTADAEMQAKLTASFARMSIMTYADRFRSYDGEEFRILGQRPGPRDTVLVDTEIDRGPNARLAPGDTRTVPITYAMALDDGKWRIVDVLLDRSISELALRRSEYNGILRDGGPAKLVEVLDRKSNQLAASE